MDFYYIYSFFHRVIFPILVPINIVIMLVVHFGYKKLYFNMKKRYLEKQLELEAVKQIYEGCREAERKTGVKVDYDGNIKITRVAQNGKEACDQIDAISKHYDDIEINLRS